MTIKKDHLSILRGWQLSSSLLSTRYFSRVAHPFQLRACGNCLKLTPLGPQRWAQACPFFAHPLPHAQSRFRLIHYRSIQSTNFCAFFLCESMTYASRSIQSRLQNRFIEKFSVWFAQKIGNFCWVWWPLVGAVSAAAGRWLLRLWMLKRASWAARLCDRSCCVVACQENTTAMGRCLSGERQRKRRKPCWRRRILLV